MISDDSAILNIVNTNEDGEVDEGDDATFEIRLFGEVTGTVSVDWATDDGTATQPSDYTTASGTANLSAIDRAETITIMTIPDTSDELDHENFVVNLTNQDPSSIPIESASASVNITDDDGIPEINFGTLPPILEGNS